MFPQKKTKIQNLREDDETERVEFAHSCKHRMPKNPNVLRSIVFSDECVFRVLGIANTENTQTWGTENPKEVQKHERHSYKLTVWGAIHFEGVLDPF